MIIMDLGIAPEDCVSNAEKNPLAAYLYEGNTYLLFKSVGGSTTMRIFRNHAWYSYEDSKIVIEKGEKLPAKEILNKVEAYLYPGKSMFKIFSNWLFNISYKKQIDAINRIYTPLSRHPKINDTTRSLRAWGVYCSYGGYDFTKPK